MSHTQCGKRVVGAHEGNKIIVLFDKAEKETLSFDAVIENGPLEAAG
jgi:hypothetical protein